MNDSFKDPSEVLFYGTPEFLPLRVYPNINGSSRKELIEQRIAVTRACDALMEALGAMRPHARDFQTMTKGEYESARAAWNARFAMIDALKNTTRDEANALSDPASTYVPIRAIAQNGSEYWYTGKAGDGWVSPDRKDAFLGYNPDGARHTAERFNRISAVHGLHFDVPQSA